MKNKRCPLQDECERPCQFEGRELECDYYYLNGVEGRGIADLERIREEREREEIRKAMDEQLEDVPDPDDEPSGVPDEPAAADTLAAPDGETTVTAPRELRDVTADIWAVRRQVARQALTGAIEVGRLLVEAKAMVPHGEWGTYIKEELDYSQSTANNLMKIFEEYGQSQQSLFGVGANSQALGNLTYTKALALLALPADEREKFAEDHDVEDMSARELQQAIKERDAAKATLEAEQTISADLRRQVELAKNAREEAEIKVQAAEKTATEAAQAMETARKELEELKARPVPVEKPDPAEVDRLAEEKVAEAQKAHEKRVAELEQKLAAAEATAKEAEEALKNAQAGAADLEAKAEAAAQAKVAELEQKLAVAAPEVAAFQVHYDAVQREFSAMVDTVNQLTTAGHEKAPGLKAALQALAKWTTEVAE